MHGVTSCLTSSLSKKGKRAKRAGPRSARKETPRVVREIYESLHQPHISWMLHRSSVSPFRTLPAPGVAARAVVPVTSVYKGTMSGACCALIFNPTLACREKVSVKTAGGTFEAFPVYTGTAVNPSTAMALSAQTGTGVINSTECGHSQFVSAELTIMCTQKVLDQGGLGYHLDGARNSPLVGLSFTSASPASTAFTFEQYQVAPKTAGVFSPGGRPIHLRFSPHGKSLEQWYESSYYVSLDSNNLEDIFFNLDGPPSGSVVATERGYDQGVIINSADDTTEYSYELVIRTRWSPITPNIVNPSHAAPSRLATGVVKAAPSVMSEISAASATIAKAARDSGYAMTSVPKPMGSFNLRKALETGGVMGAAGLGATKLLENGPSLARAAKVASQTAASGGGLFETLGGLLGDVAETAPFIL